MTAFFPPPPSNNNFVLVYLIPKNLLLIIFFLWTSIANSENSISNTQVRGFVEKTFPHPSEVREQLPDLPIRPVFSHSKLTGYVFQSIDFVDLRGFSGKPINMLIGINTEGTFKGVHILEHHEPMFTHDLKGAMQQFVDQYSGISVSSKVVIDVSGNGLPDTDTATIEKQAGTIYFDGISKATISLAVINKTVLSSALHIARLKLDEYKQKQIRIARTTVYEPLNWTALLKENLVKKWAITQDRLERRTGLPLDAYQDPNLDISDPSDDLNIYYAYLNTPMIGKNILGEQGFERLMSQLKPGEHAIGIITDGFYSFLNATTFIPTQELDNLYLEQQSLTIPMRAISIEKALKNNSSIKNRDLYIFKVSPHDGLVPDNTMSLILNMALTLPNGKLIEVRFKNDYKLPERLFETVNPEAYKTTTPLWVDIWRNRATDIIVLCLGLLILTIVFIRQKSYSRQAKRFHQFRWIFLAFTLFFIGFYAQGQLSVINIYTLLLELTHGFTLDFFLLDPIIFTLWVYTAISLILWGRGLFCGWLCPFGVLQEFVSWVAKKCKLKQLKISPTANKKLIYIKYIILLFLIATAFYSTGLAEKLAEVEPFKTSITFFFLQSWPLVTYALLILALGLFIHKFYCRYICPLGAGLAILGRLRKFEWLDRRTECGSPCQVCRHRCGINAINRQGSIDYNECIQCLECIVIINDNKQCAPAMVEAKKAAAAHKVSPVKFVTPT